MDINLSENDRVKLDGIVQQMVVNKEPDENIQWVVNDFKQKYGQSQQIPTPEEQASLTHNTTQTTNFNTPGSIGSVKDVIQNKMNAISENLDKNNQAIQSGDIPAAMDAVLSFAPIGATKVAAEGGNTLLNAAKSIYQKAMKPSTTLSEVAKNKVITTGLNEAIPVSAKGLKKSQGIVGNLNDIIKQRISEYAQQGETVDRGAVSSKLDDLASKEIATNPLPDANIDTISKIQNELVSGQPKEIPIDQAQVFKQTLNKELNDFYKAYNSGKTVPPKMWAQARASIADGLREEISKVFPEISALNQREGSLIELNKQLGRAVNRISNRNLLSITKAILGVGGASVGGVTGALKGVLIDSALNNPAITSRIAIAMNKFSKLPPTVGQTATAGIKATGLKVGNEINKNWSKQIGPFTIEEINE